MDGKWAQPPAPRHQVVLFTETLDDAIPQNHPIRLLDRCLDTVDWTLWENRHDGRRGQPPIHPRLAAGCILYGLMRNLRTTRTLEDATANRLGFLWLLERRTIDRSTFADFRVEFKTDCPLANECVKGKAGHRKITRDSYQHLRDKVGRRMATEAGMKIYKKRAPVVEGVFGVIKHAMGVRRFLLRGLEKVRTEWTWVCTAFNLKKLLRIWALNPPGGGA